MCFINFGFGTEQTSGTGKFIFYFYRSYFRISLEIIQKNLVKRRFGKKINLQIL